MSRFLAPSRKLAAHRREHGGPRIYDPRERLAVAGFDLFLRSVSPLVGLRPARDRPEPLEAKRVLAMRLDRLGDLLTTLPALQALRAAAPQAHLELAVGSWNEPIARRLPFVDRVRIVDVPWAAWGGTAKLRTALGALAGEEPFDLAFDFQGDVRGIVLMALARARLRAWYGETGGAYLLTHRARWDERKSWYWQNLELVRTVFPDAPHQGLDAPYNFLMDRDREEAASMLRAHGLKEARRPLIGIHPSAGRRLKQWESEKFVTLVDALADEATVVLTGAVADRELVERIETKAARKPVTLVGAPLATFAALVEAFDVFVTGDTGPMHLSHAVRTPNVALFGPSDPERYGPDEALGLRTVVRRPVYCSPCNMIRRPPRECVRGDAPECISGIAVEQVLDAVRSRL